MNKIYLILLIALTSFVESYSQNNIHYSQYYNAPLLLNPALAGQFPNDLLRLTGIARQQWSGESYAGDYLYKTYSGSADISFANRRIGIGLLVLNDQVADVFNTMKIAPTISYSFIMGDDALTFGAQPVVNNYAIKNDTLWLQGGTQFVGSSYSNFDFNFGINFHKDLVFAKFDLGASAQQMLQAKGSYLGNTANRATMYYRTYIYTDWDITESFKIMPGFYGSFQSQSTNLLIGSNVSLRALGKSEEGTRMIAGLWFRSNYNNLESIIPKMGFQSGKLKVLASYDYNTGMTLSNSHHFNALLNTFEISIIFTAKPKKVPPLLEDRFILNPRY